MDYLSNNESYNLISKLKTSFAKKYESLSTDIQSLAQYVELYNNLFNDYHKNVDNEIKIYNKYNTNDDSATNYQNLTLNLQGVINTAPVVNYNIEETQKDNKSLEQSKLKIEELESQMSSCENLLIDLSRSVTRNLKSFLDIKNDVDFNFNSMIK